MFVTENQLLLDLDKYLLLSKTEDIYITQNGRIVSKLSNPYKDQVDIAKSLFGIIPADFTAEEAKEERLDHI